LRSSLAQPATSERLRILNGARIKKKQSWELKNDSGDLVIGITNLNAAVAAAVAAFMLGPRHDCGRQALLPHNVPFVLLGTGLLWSGWPSTAPAPVR